LPDRQAARDPGGGELKVPRASARTAERTTSAYFARGIKNMSSINAAITSLPPANVETASTERRQAMLRQAVDEMVGVTFFGQMLKMARNSPLKGEIGHGGRGEE